MLRRFVIALILLLCGAPGAAAQISGPPAIESVRAALEAMGGEARWRDLGALRVSGIGHQHALEQSERPEGPWVTTYLQFDELRDLSGGRLRRTSEARGFWSNEWQPLVQVADREAASVERGGRTGPARRFEHRKALQSLDLSPERVLLTALDSAELEAAGDTLLQGVPHRIVTFRWDDRTARLYLNAATRLPAALALPEPEGELFQAIWGDTPTMTIWSLWSLEPGGWLYPRQRDVYRLGYPLESEILSSVEFEPAAPPDSFAIAPDVRRAFVEGPGFDFFALGPGQVPGAETAAPIELATGVVTLPGMYAATWVEQADGVVVLEATMTAGWSRAVLEEAARRFPDRPVKAVLSTSDAWPHVGGVREFVAAGVPVYALDLNVPFLERLVAAPRVRQPDLLARSPRIPEFRAVSGTTMIGEGANRIVLHPVRGEGGERMMLAWMPERRILYASDLVQIGPDGAAFWPEYLAEVVAVVEREGLNPETVFAMHTPPRPWTDVLQILSETARPVTPAH